MTNTDRAPAAALLALIILQSVMLAALYAGVAPHPPATIVPFAIAPFLGVALSVAVTALVLGAGSNRAGRWFGFFAALLALISFGPQKYFDAQFALIWPAVVGGQVASAVLIANLLTPRLIGRGKTAQEART